MKMKYIIVSLVMSATLMWAAFDNTFQGNARGLAMAGAYAAACEDESAVFLNAGGLAFLSNPVFGFTGSSLYTGLTVGSLLAGRVSGTYTLSTIGTLGLGLNQLSVKIDDNVKYSESVYALSFGRKLNSKIGLGINVNVPRWSADLAGDTSFRSSSLVVSVDMGLMIKQENGLRFGAALYGVNQPVVGVDKKESIPLSGRIGASYVMPKSDFVFNSDVFYSDDRIDFSAGAEYKLNAVRLRAGVALPGITDGVNVSAGAGYTLNLSSGAVKIDYAFVYSPTGVGGTIGSHFVSASYAFGQTVSVTKVKEKAVEAVESVEETETVEPVEDTASDTEVIEGETVEPEAETNTVEESTTNQ